MIPKPDVRDNIEPGSLDSIFRPTSVAVIGATPRKGTIGRQILHNLINYEFTGSIFPVNPKHAVVHSFKCYPRVIDIPDPVSLAFIIVPRDAVLQVPVCNRAGSTLGGNSAPPKNGTSQG